MIAQYLADEHDAALEGGEARAGDQRTKPPAGNP
jgi:hypothetical protein